MKTPIYYTEGKSPSKPHYKRRTRSHTTWRKSNNISIHTKKILDNKCEKQNKIYHLQILTCIRHGAKMTTQLMGLTSQYENNTIKPIFLHWSGLCRTNTN